MKYIIFDYEMQGYGGRSRQRNCGCSQVAGKATDLSSARKSHKFIEKYKLNKQFKQFKKTKIYKKYKLHQQNKQLRILKKEFVRNDLELIHIMISMTPKELRQLSLERIHSAVLAQEKDMYLLAVCKELESYLPLGIPWCSYIDEVYINLLAEQLFNLCRNYGIVKRDARLLFLDDGAYDVKEYIEKLTTDWNYVSVFSNRHEELEEVYRHLYEQEGLMVECLSEEMWQNCRGDIVIDLMRDWKRTHRIYPKNSFVLDVTFSHEKEKYLRDKQTKIEGYIQIVSLLGI